ncbi:MAG: hypothetical protein RSB09_04380, partial [Clostridia bacterium]
MAKKKDKIEGLSDTNLVADKATEGVSAADGAAVDESNLASGEQAGAETEKKGAKARVKSKSREKRDWEDGLVSTKRVKREERRRNLKKAMVLLLVFSIITTSVVYVMLMFIQENNIRITASSSDDNKAITLSMDNISWTPYLDALGPDYMRDLSYNPIYGREKIPTVDEAITLVSANETIGNRCGKEYIAFGFMLRNNSTGSVDLPISYKMTLTSNEKKLENTIRVMWAESYSRPEAGSPEPNCKIYAAASDNDRLAVLASNKDKKKGEYIEKIAYPLGSDNIGNANYDLYAYENNPLVTDKIKHDNGFFDTVPFASSDRIFENSSTLHAGEILYVYVSV